MAMDVRAALQVISDAIGGRGPTVLLRDVWIAWLAAHARLRTLRVDRQRWTTWIEPSMGDREVASLRAIDLVAMLSRMRRHRPATRNRVVSLLSRLLRWGARAGVCGRASVIDAIEMEPEDNVREVVLEEADVAAILAAGRPELRALALLCYDSGMRLGEAAGLRWRQLDEQRMVLRLSANETKTRSAREPDLSPRALEALREDWPEVGEHVFYSPRTGRPILGTTWAHWWRDAAAACPSVRGLRGERPTIHDLRRSWATRARRAGVPEGVVARMLGHRTWSTTERYQIVCPSDQQAARDQIRAARDRAIAELRAAQRRGPQHLHPRAVPAQTARDA